MDEDLIREVDRLDAAIAAAHRGDDRMCEKLADILVQITRMEERMVTHDDFQEYREEVRTSRRWAVGAAIASAGVTVGALQLFLGG